MQLRHLTTAQRRVLCNTWSSLIDRCTNPETSHFADYGGRGITVCDRWLDSFDAFAVDMGVRPDGMSLDRINVNRGYSPDNCRWATKETQARNTRRNRLTEVDVREILKLVYQDGVPLPSVALVYPARRQHLDRIVRGEVYRIKGFDYSTFALPPAERNKWPTKLTENDVVDIRRARAGGETFSSIAKRYSVCVRTAIYAAKGEKTWQHVPFPSDN